MRVQKEYNHKPNRCAVEPPREKSQQMSLLDGNISQQREGHSKYAGLLGTINYTVVFYVQRNSRRQEEVEGTMTMNLYSFNDGSFRFCMNSCSVRIMLSTCVETYFHVHVSIMFALLMCCSARSSHQLWPCLSEGNPNFTSR